MSTIPSKLIPLMAISLWLNLILFPASRVKAGREPFTLPALSGASSVAFGWARDMGGSDQDSSSAIVLDGSGNVYTTGYFIGTADFDPGEGVYNLTSPENANIFISKLDRGGKFVWAKGLGGIGDDSGVAIKVDGSGNLYTTGFFWGTVDFDPGEGVYNLTSAGDNDIFVSKLDSSGNFVWAKAMGGRSDDYANAMAVDGSGNLYTTGYFHETADFDPGEGVYNLTSTGNTDIFVSKLDNSGNFVWAKGIGGTGYDYGFAITTNASGDVYTTGYFRDTVDFDPGGGIYNLTSAGWDDIFVSMLDSDGHFAWAKGMGGSSYDEGFAITLDAGGNVYTTGSFYGVADFDPGEGVYNLTSAGNDDIFVSKLDSSGNFVWAKGMGGSNDNYGLAITADASGNVYTTGSFLGTADFDPGTGVYNLTSAGSSDIFISRLDSDGKFVWAKGMGGSNDDCGNAITLDGSRNVYATGEFKGTVDFDPGPGVYNLTSAGDYDIFMVKLMSTIRSTLKSQGAQDGWILEASEASNTGGTTNSTATTFYLGDDAHRQQYRSVLSFNTKGLPNHAVITRVSLKVRKQGISGGGNPMNLFQGLMVDIRKGFFGPAAGLQASDFQAIASQSYGPFKPDLVNGWYTINLTPAKAYINKLATNGGVTQIRLRFKLDDDNNGMANYLSLYSGNAMVASRPQLILEYYVP